MYCTRDTTPSRRKQETLLVTSVQLVMANDFADIRVLLCCRRFAVCTPCKSKSFSRAIVALSKLARDLRAYSKRNFILSSVTFPLFSIYIYTFT